MKKKKEYWLTVTSGTFEGDAWPFETLIDLWTWAAKHLSEKTGREYKITYQDFRP